MLKTALAVLDDTWAQHFIFNSAFLYDLMRKSFIIDGPIFRFDMKFLFFRGVLLKIDIPALKNCFCYTLILKRHLV